MTYKRLPITEEAPGSLTCTCPFCGGCFDIDREQQESIGGNRFDCRCLRCGHVWGSRVEDPQKCPSCGSSSWRGPTNSCTCALCGHTWVPKRPYRPIRCPSCRSRNWEKGKPLVVEMVRIEEPKTVREKWIVEKYSKGEGCMAIAAETGMALFTVMSVVSRATGTRTPILRGRFRWRREQR